MLFRKLDVIVPPDTLTEATEATSFPISQAYPVSHSTVTIAVMIATVCVLAVAICLVVRKIKANRKCIPCPASDPTITEETKA